MKTVQKAAIKYCDRLLLLLRPSNNSSFPGQWDFPGGKLKKGESLTRGLEREILEETSLEVRILRVLGDYIENINGEVNRFVLYETMKIYGEVNLNNEHVAHMWVTNEDIINLVNLSPVIKKYLEINDSSS